MSSPRDGTLRQAQDLSQLTVRQLLAECKRQGLPAGQCLERAELEALLSQSTASQAHAATAGAVEMAAVREELASWVIYAPRARSLLTTLGRCPLDRASAREGQLDVIVRRYTKHPDAGVVSVAQQLLEKWTPSQPEAALPQEGHRKRRKVVASDDDSDCLPEKKTPRRKKVKMQRDDVMTVESDDDYINTATDVKEGPSPPQRLGWFQADKEVLMFRGRQQIFRTLELRGPFKCQKWFCQMRISEESYEPEALELLNQMARDFGAVIPAPGEECSAADEQLLRRLKRLEERFKGNGVTEGEARNAMRLFERELSKANWTEDKFAKLKRQLEGSEEWSIADTVVEAAVHWTSPSKRRQAWFSDVGERVGVPLGLMTGYAPNGGIAFVGPLSTVAGALLTTALICHFADLDLACAVKLRGGSKMSSPQFLQGFVDGSLSEDRHLVWEKMFQIEDGAEAARFCEERVQGGFFDDDEHRPDASEPDDDSAVQDLLRGLFSTYGTASSSRTRNSRPQSHSPTDGAAFTPPASYTPFSGTGKRLGDDDVNDPASGRSASSKGTSRSSSWAITFASNLQVARQSRERSRAEAKKTYHWTFSGKAVKATQTGTESYTKGKQAGEKRKAEIDTTTGTAKRKYKKGARLAITE